MSREIGDPCPHCNGGKLTVHSDRGIHENADGGSGDHKTWLCDKCGKITRDVTSGLIDKINVSDNVQAQKGVSRELKDDIGGISDSIKVQKNVGRELKDETGTSDDPK